MIGAWEGVGNCMEKWEGLSWMLGLGISKGFLGISKGFLGIFQGGEGKKKNPKKTSWNFRGRNPRKRGNFGNELSWEITGGDLRYPRKRGIFGNKEFRDIEGRRSQESQEKGNFGNKELSWEILRSKSK